VSRLRPLLLQLQEQPSKRWSIKPKPRSNPSPQKLPNSLIHTPQNFSRLPSPKKHTLSQTCPRWNSQENSTSALPGRNPFVEMHPSNFLTPLPKPKFLAYLNP
jgi:hypothetical protein